MSAQTAVQLVDGAGRLLMNQWYDGTADVFRAASQDFPMPTGAGGGSSPQNIPGSLLRQNSTHCRYPNVLGNVREWFGYSLHLAKDDLTWSRVGFANYTAFQEIFNTGALQVTTGLEFPLGRDDLQMYSYQGGFVGSGPAGADIMSDALVYDTKIPKGSWYKLWHFHQNLAGGIPFASNGPQPWTNDASHGLDILSGTLGTAINYFMFTATAAERAALANTDASSNNKVVPMCIVSDTKVRSWGYLGDSRASGQGSAPSYLFDYVSDASLNACAAERIYGPLGAWINLSATQDSATSFLSGSGGRRSNYLNYVTDVVNLFGTNDFGVTADVPSTIALDAKIANLAQVRGKKFWGGTIPPKTTSTDQWLTLANQTVTAKEVNRLGLNTYRRGLPAIYTGGVIDFASIVEDAPTGKWNVAAGARTLTGAMTVGSNVFTAATGAFSAADNGKRIIVTGAAASAGLLAAQMVYVDATHVNLIDAVKGTPVNAATAVTVATTYVQCREFTADGTHETQFSGKAYQAALVATA